MHRTDGDGHVGGLFTEGNPAMGQVATQVTDDWLNDVQEEVCNVITDAGIALVKGTRTQLRDAIASKILAAVSTVQTDTLPLVSGDWTGTVNVEKDATGRVFLRGARGILNPVTMGKLATNMGGIPAGFRPAVMVRFSGVLEEQDATPALKHLQPVVIQIDTNGDMSISGFSGPLTYTYYAIVTLEGLTYRAA